MAELADAPDSKSGSERSVGSTPTARTNPPGPWGRNPETGKARPRMIVLRGLRLPDVQVLVTIALGIPAGFYSP